LKFETQTILLTKFKSPRSSLLHSTFNQCRMHLLASATDNYKPFVTHKHTLPKLFSESSQSLECHNSNHSTC